MKCENTQNYVFPEEEGGKQVELVLQVVRGFKWGRELMFDFKPEMCNFVNYFNS